MSFRIVTHLISKHLPVVPSSMELSGRYWSGSGRRISKRCDGEMTTSEASQVHPTGIAGSETRGRT